MRRAEHFAVFLPVILIVGFVGWSVYGTVVENRAKSEAAAKATEERNSKARAAGFADANEMASAAAAGIQDVNQWRAQASERAKKEAEKVAERARLAAEVQARIDRDRAAGAARLAELTRNPIERMQISNSSWKTGGFGSIGIMTMTITNSNDFAIKDIDIACRFYGKSGTLLTLLSHTIYDTIQAKAKQTFREVNVGFINSQSSRAGCDLISAKRL